MNLKDFHSCCRCGCLAPLQSYTGRPLYSLGTLGREARAQTLTSQAAPVQSKHANIIENLAKMIKNDQKCMSSNGSGLISRTRFLRVSVSKAFSGARCGRARRRQRLGNGCRSQARVEPTPATIHREASNFLKVMAPRSAS